MFLPFKFSQKWTLVSVILGSATVAVVGVIEEANSEIPDAIAFVVGKLLGVWIASALIGFVVSKIFMRKTVHGFEKAFSVCLIVFTVLTLRVFSLRITGQI